MILKFRRKRKERKGGFYFLALLVYAYVPDAAISKINAMMTAVADENSFTLGVGVVEVLIGLNIGW